MKTGSYVVAGLAVAAAIVIVTIFAGLLRFSSQNEGSGMTEQPKDDILYLYLFKENPDLRDSGTGAYYLFYEEITMGIGQITEPSSEQLHYGIGRDGVYKNWLTDERIERFSSVKMIISDSIKKPDGSTLEQNDFSPDARFLYSPYYRATLVMEDDGTMYVMNQDRYNNPKNLPLERMVGVVTLPVEAVDFPTINSHYDEIKERIESYEPRQVQNPPATILLGEPEVIFDKRTLKLIAETINGRANVPSIEPTDPLQYLNDTNGISLRLYHGNNASSGAEIIAVSLTNPSTDSINLYQLHILGYVSIMDSRAESQLLYRPVISDEYEVTKPTSTDPTLIPPGGSITAYIEAESLGIDLYGASACYTYVGKEDSPNDFANEQGMSNHYCFHTKQQ